MVTCCNPSKTWFGQAQDPMCLALPNPSPLCVKYPGNSDWGVGRRGGRGETVFLLCHPSHRDRKKGRNLCVCVCVLESE